MDEISLLPATDPNIWMRKIAKIYVSINYNKNKDIDEQTFIANHATKSTHHFQSSKPIATSRWTRRPDIPHTRTLEEEEEKAMH